MRTQPTKPGDVPAKKQKANPWAKVGEPKGASIYENANAEIVMSAITIASKHGDAILFGCTSDGGAVSITWLHDKKKDKLYPASTEALEDALEALTLYYA